MRRALAILVLLVPASVLAEDLHGDVLVWDDAKVRFDPDDAATEVQLVGGSGPRDDHVGAAFAMKVVGLKGDWVELEPETSYGCTGATLKVFDLSRPHVFAQRADLAPVLAKPFRASFPDLSSVELHPGIAVHATSGGDVVAQLELHDVTLKIPEASIAQSYPPSRPQPVGVRNGVKIYVTTEGTPVGFAGTTWSGMQLRLETERATKKGDRMLLELPDRCGTLVVSAPADQVKTVTSPDFGHGLGGFASGPAPDYLPAGTVVATASGRKVGTTTTKVSATVSADGKLACGSFRVDLDVVAGRHAKTRHADIQLCAPVKAAKLAPRSVQKTLPPEY